MRPLKFLALFAALGLASAAPCGAFCEGRTGFPVYQCGDRAWFERAPDGSGAVRAVFWQIGFGNATIDNGRGVGGMGVAPAGVFSGNDSGLAEVPLLAAAGILGDERVPEGALCLGPANWASRDVDGCCDNRRDPESLRRDGFLNPLFDPDVLKTERRFSGSLRRVEDYPIAVLLTEETGAHFAVAAVAAARRDGVQDLRSGHFTLADVRNGKPNPITGAPNVVPWQSVPRPALDLLERAAGGERGGSGEAWRVRASWEPVVLHSDLSRIPSEAHEIDNPGGGVGVADMGPLVRYRLERAPLLEALTDAAGYPAPELLLWETVAETEEASAVVEEVPEDTCLRVVVLFGKRPRTRFVSAATCGLGRCGDIGYLVTGAPVCVEGALLRAAGGRRGGDG